MKLSNHVHLKLLCFHWVKPMRYSNHSFGTIEPNSISKMALPQAVADRYILWLTLVFLSDHQPICCQRIFGYHHGYITLHCWKVRESLICSYLICVVSTNYLICTLPLIFGLAFFSLSSPPLLSKNSGLVLKSLLLNVSLIIICGASAEIRDFRLIRGRFLLSLVHALCGYSSCYSRIGPRRD